MASSSSFEKWIPVNGSSELRQDLGELHQHQLSKEGADADVSEIIAFAANRAAAGGIVSVLGMVKHLLHEPGEGLWSAIFNLFANELNQSGISSLCIQRLTLNVQRSTFNFYAPNLTLGVER